MTQGLAISDVVNVSVTIGAVASATRNFGTLLIVGQSAILAPTESLRSYTSLTTLGDDFAVTLPEYLAAEAFFSQAPQPALCYVGQWRTGETLAACYQRLAAASGDWYGVVCAAPAATATDTIQLAAAAVIDGSSPVRLNCVTTQEPGVLTVGGTTDMAALMSAANFKASLVQFSTTNPYAAASLFGVFATVDYTGVNTTITGFLKNEPSIGGDVIGETGYAAIKAKDANAFVAFQDGSFGIVPAVMSSGQFIDEHIGLDWLQNSLQIAGFNAIKSLGKIPQTNDGMNVLAGAYETVMDQAVANGLLAPGVWTGPDIGPLSTGDALPKGYLIYTAPITTQVAADRAARKAVPAQIACILAGAVQSAACLVSVQR